MCFNICRGHEQQEVAKKNITCYKVVLFDEESNKYISQFTLFEYELKKIYRHDDITIEDLVTTGEKIVNRGFHSYSKLPSLRLLNGWVNPEHEGKKLVVIECVLPKGARYYHNPRAREYVSDNIMTRRAFPWGSCVQPTKGIGTGGSLRYLIET